MTLEKLAAPPIAEVICGVIFDPVPGLDPLSVGWYALDRLGDYPKRQLQPPITDPGVLLVGPTAPVRAWLISEDEVFLLQVQHDRFFLNWRARGADYPRFNQHGGQPGLLQRVVEEFDGFSRFCQERLGVAPVVRRTELAKVDHLIEGVHWEGLDDLAEAIPAILPILNLASSAKPAVAFNMSEATELGQLRLSVTMQQRKTQRDKSTDVVVLESRSIGQAAPGISIEDDLIKRNDQVNGVFELLIPAEQRSKRFGKGEPS